MSRDAIAIAYCSGVWVKIADRYSVPTSLPWRKPCVGSWSSQKVRSSCSSEICFGSYTTRTASAWPVFPEHDSRYVGFGVVPPW